MSLSIKIEDWYDLHKGFTLKIEPGFTALVGPNGAGKTTLLQQIKEFADKEKIDVWEYSNLHDGGSMGMERYAFSGDITNLASAVMSSEGECVALNFSNRVGELGQAVSKHVEAKTPLIVLLDAIDSGASIDRARDIRGLFDLIEKNDISKGAEVYIVMAVNHFELAKSPSDCVNVRNGKHMKFGSYDRYAEFICSFMEEMKIK